MEKAKNIQNFLKIPKMLIFWAYRLTNRFMNRLTIRLPKSNRMVDRRITDRLETLIRILNSDIPLLKKYVVKGCVIYHHMVLKGLNALCNCIS